MAERDNPGASPVFRPLKERVTVCGLGMREWLRTFAVAGVGVLLAIGLGNWTQVTVQEYDDMAYGELQDEYEAVLSDVKGIQSRMDETGAKDIADVDATSEERESWKEAGKLGIEPSMTAEQVDDLVPTTHKVRGPVIPDLARWLVFCILPVIVSIGVQFEAFRNSSIAGEFGRWRDVRRREAVYASDPRAYMDAASEAVGRA